MGDEEEETFDVKDVVEVVDVKSGSESEKLVLAEAAKVDESDINKMSMEELREFIKIGIKSVEDDAAREEVSVARILATLNYLTVFQEATTQHSGPVQFVEIFENPEDMLDDDNDHMMKVMGMEGIEEMVNGMEIVSIDDPNEESEPVKFIEIVDTPEHMMITTPASSEVEVVDESSPSAGEGSDFTEAGIPSDDLEEEERNVMTNKEVETTGNSLMDTMIKVT